MDENNLSFSMSQSITEECSELVSSIAEVTLDSVLEDGLLKDIPIIASAISIYKLGTSLRERHELLKLYHFVKSLNNGMQDEEQREKYILNFQNDQKIRNKELAYLMVVLDKYINLDKPKMLAKIYLSYLNGEITWNEVMKYSEVIDRLLPGDVELLAVGIRENVNYQNVDDGILRLVALGLMVSFPDKTEYNNHTIAIADGRDQNYMWTKFGETFVNILTKKEME